ncbi:hypothetical protein GCM10023317_21740 [Actinopolymorpha pittospori]
MAALGGAFSLLVGTAGPAAAMSGGQPVDDPDAAPWVATLAVRGDAPLLQLAGCGGALVAPDRVLTAVHCVDHVDPSQLDVHINARVLSEEAGEVRPVRGISVLPGYEILPSPVDPTDPNLSSARNDLAVILLDRPIHDIAPLRIAEHRPSPGSAVSMFAHGSTGQAGQGEFRNDILHRGDLTALGAEACERQTPATVDRRSVTCAQDVAGAVTGCYQDSGSPVVSYSGGRPALVGLFSFGGETAGKACGEPSPAYSADVTNLRRWAFARHPVLQPYPARAARVSGTPVVGATLHCVPPRWSRSRGGLPQTAAYQWVTVTYLGPFVFPAPVEGADTADLRVGADLADQQVACQVTAANGGGTSTATSDPVSVSP